MVLHQNVNNILAQITSAIGAKGINIVHLTNKSRGEFAATIVDVETEIPASVIEELNKVEGIIRIRVIK